MLIHVWIGVCVLFCSVRLVYACCFVGMILVCRLLLVFVVVRCFVCLFGCVCVLCVVVICVVRVLVVMLFAVCCVVFVCLLLLSLQ